MRRFACIVHSMVEKLDPRSDSLSPDPVIEVYLRDVDRTLLRENLRLSVDERLNKLFELQQFAAELRRAGAALRSKS